ncbi:MAG: ROK family protein [Alphaproteobacteria bacterium]|nr:ROK family protein [Alphaproteobacteria bacterium]
MRIGIDLGGTKIEVVALSRDGQAVLRRRRPTPKSGYDASVGAIAELVREAEHELGERCTVGVAIPGTLSARTGLVKNANSTQLIGHPLDADLALSIGRTVRVANDANCFALSEASDGAARSASTVFGVIAGTGVGGGVCVEGKILEGAHAIAGEWGHNPLPAPTCEELEQSPLCYCGRHGCIESWISGPGLSADFLRNASKRAEPGEISRLAACGDGDAARTMERFYDRFARALSTIVNILDPEVIVIGGGLSNIDRLYQELPARVEAYSFSPEGPSRIVRNVHGDSSGVRGAAWLWADGEPEGLPQ